MGVFNDFSIFNSGQFFFLKKKPRSSFIGIEKPNEFLVFTLYHRPEPTYNCVSLSVSDCFYKGAKSVFPTVDVCFMPIICLFTYSCAALRSLSSGVWSHQFSSILIFMSHAKEKNKRARLNNYCSWSSRTMVELKEYLCIISIFLEHVCGFPSKNNCHFFCCKWIKTITTLEIKLQSVRKKKKKSW